MSGSTNKKNDSFDVIRCRDPILDSINEGVFRQDLYYRVHVFSIDIPPLMDRREDIPLLVDCFVDSLNLTHDREVTGLSPDAYTLIMNHNFPGNVRELQNNIEHAFVLCSGGMIQPAHLPRSLHKQEHDSIDVSNPQDGMDIKAVETKLIRRALEKHEGNRNRAAQELGINPSTLYRKIKKYDIEVPDKDGRGTKSQG